MPHPPIYAAPCDYKGGTFNVTIPACKEDRIHACKKEATLLVKTEQNSLTEVDEDFKATLSLSPGVENVDVVVDTAFITIVDTTGEYIQSLTDNY